MDARGQDVLALDVHLGDRAASPSPAVIPARRRPRSISPIDAGRTTPNRSAELDNHFCPSQAEGGSLFTVIFGVVLLSLVAGTAALIRFLGAL